MAERNVASQIRVMTEEELAKRWHMSRAGLRGWRRLGKGPAYLKLAGAIRYRLDDVEAFEEAARIRPENAA